MASNMNDSMDTGIGYVEPPMEIGTSNAAPTIDLTAEQQMPAAEPATSDNTFRQQPLAEGPVQSEVSSGPPSIMSEGEFAALNAEVDEILRNEEVQLSQVDEELLNLADPDYNSNQSGHNLGDDIPQWDDRVSYLFPAGDSSVAQVMAPFAPAEPGFNPIIPQIPAVVDNPFTSAPTTSSHHYRTWSGDNPVMWDSRVTDQLVPAESPATISPFAPLVSPLSSILPKASSLSALSDNPYARPPTSPAYTLVTTVSPQSLYKTAPLEHYSPTNPGTALPSHYPPTNPNAALPNYSPTDPNAVLPSRYPPTGPSPQPNISLSALLGGDRPRFYPPSMPGPAPRSPTFAPPSPSFSSSSSEKEDGSDPKQRVVIPAVSVLKTFKKKHGPNTPIPEYNPSHFNDADEEQEAWEDVFPSQQVQPFQGASEPDEPLTLNFGQIEQPDEPLTLNFGQIEQPDQQPLQSASAVSHEACERKLNDNIKSLQEGFQRELDLMKAKQETTISQAVSTAVSKAKDEVVNEHGTRWNNMDEALAEREAALRKKEEAIAAKPNEKEKVAKDDLKNQQTAAMLRDQRQKLVAKHDQLEADRQSLEAEIKTLKDQCAQAVAENQSMKDQLANPHGEGMDVVTDSLSVDDLHQQHLAQLEAQDAQHQSELSELKEKHSQELKSKLKFKALAENPHGGDMDIETDTSAADDIFQQSIEQLEAQDAQHRSEISELKEKHKQELASMEHKLRGENAVAEQKLQLRYNAQRQEQRQQFLNEKKEYEAQASKRQLELPTQAQEKGDSAAPAQKSESDYATLIQKLNADSVAHSQKLEADHAAHLQNLNQTYQDRYNAEVEKLQSNHAAALEELQAGHSTTHVPELESDHAAQVQKLESDHAAHVQKIESDHAAHIQHLDQTYEDRHKAEVENLKSSYAAALEELQAGHSTTHVPELESDHAAQVQKLESDHAAHVQKMEDDHAAQVQMLQEDSDAERFRLATEIREAVLEEKSSVDAAMLEMTANHDAAMLETTTNHDAAILEMTANHDAAMLELKTNHDAAMLKLKTNQHKTLQAQLNSQHDKVKADYESQLKDRLEAADKFFYEQHEKHQAQEAHLAKELSEQKEVLEGHQAQEARLTKELSEQQELLAGHQAQEARLTNELSEQQNLLEAQHGMTAQVRQEKESMADEVSQLQDAVRRLTSKSDDLQKVLDEETDRLAKASEDLQEADRKLELESADRKNGLKRERTLQKALKKAEWAYEEAQMEVARLTEDRTNNDELVRQAQGEARDARLQQEAQQEEHRIAQEATRGSYEADWAMAKEAVALIEKAKRGQETAEAGLVLKSKALEDAEQMVQSLAGERASMTSEMRKISAASDKPAQVVQGQTDKAQSALAQAEHSRWILLVLGLAALFLFVSSGLWSCVSGLAAGGERGVWAAGGELSRAAAISVGAGAGAEAGGWMWEDVFLGVLGGVFGG